MRHHQRIDLLAIWRGVIAPPTTRLHESRPVIQGDGRRVLGRHLQKSRGGLLRARVVQKILHKALADPLPASHWIDGKGQQLTFPSNSAANDKSLRIAKSKDVGVRQQVCNLI